MKRVLQPTFIVKPFAGKNVVVTGFGRNGGKTNWKALVDPAIVWNRNTKKEMACAVSKIAAQRQITKIFSPNTGTFNAEICEPDDLQQKIALGQGISIFRGHNAEGTVVQQKTATVFFPADCNILIARAESGNLIAAHAGGFSLIDHAAAISGVNKSREFTSVVDAVIARFSELGDAPKNLSVFIIRGVRPSNFGYNPKDKVFGEREQKILAAFRAVDPSVVIGESGVDITQVIRLQLEKHGVPGHRIQTDTTDTYNDRDFGDFTWWSYERAMANGDKEEAAECRNLVLVINGSN